MGVDLKLLRIMKHRDEFYKISGRVPSEAMETTTVKLLELYGEFFKEFPDRDTVSPATLATLFRAKNKSMKPEVKKQYESLFPKIKADVPEDEREVIVNQMMQLRLSSAMTDLQLQWEQGDVADLYSEMMFLFEQHQKDAKITGIDYIRTDIGELLKQDANREGIMMRLECLREHLRPLRGGDFMIVAGRPNKGKTTFLASEVTYMAPQLPPGQPAVWLNNEGPGERIKQRLFQSAVGLRLSEMIAAHSKGELVSLVEETMGMRDRVRVFDIHGLDTLAVERILDTQQPGIAIYDMIDKIHGFGDAARTDLGLEKMYDWARELCVKHDLVGIATSQISVEGDGMLFPTMPMLKDSKTGKQGACDVQLMIGASNEAGYQSIRGIGLVKNKLHVEGKPEDPQAKVHFQPHIARFSDMMPEVDEDDDE